MGTPIRIISADNQNGPSDPVRIVNWNDLIAAIITAIETGNFDTLHALQAYFGDFAGGNYTEFEADGTMQAHGLATCYRDELQSVTGAQITSPAGDFQQNIPEASVTAKTSARYPTDYLTTNHQLNHDWALGTAIFPHIHWWQTTANTPHWVLAYRWQKGGSAKTTFGAIGAPVGYGQVSDIVQLRVYRDYTNVSTLFVGNDPVAADQDIVNFDSHIIIDMLGSHQEYIK